VPKMSHQQCVSSYEDLIVPSMMCCGYTYGGHDACSGDSGGSVVAQVNGKGPWFIYGITSWGIGCAEPNKPGVYTVVSMYREWIRSKCGGKQLLVCG
jgi:secreted trypsin-like serine protease